MTLIVRPTKEIDVPACVQLINKIIAVGGTTAYEEPYTEADFTAHYLHEAPVTHVVLYDGEVAGFQGAFDVGYGLYSIGSFTDREKRIRGAGRALFDATLAACRARGGVAILAKITADNEPGLAYYTRMGFADWQVWPNDATRNGVPVDRVVKRYPLFEET